MKNVLVPGGAGYIGSHTARALAAANYNPVIFDNLSEGHRKAVEGFPLVVGDLLNPADLANAFSAYKIDAVVHLAAFALVGVSMHEPLRYYRNNVQGTLNLLEAMRNAGVPYIVFSSTCATYGEPETVPITETEKTKPTNPYGETKLAVEAMLKWCDPAYGIRHVCLRYFNAAGAMADGSMGEDHRLETHLIPLLYRHILNGTEATVFGDDYPTKDGSCVRDYIHVNDLGAAHVKALQYLENRGESLVVNLGTEYGASVFEVIKAAEKVSGHKLKYKVALRRGGDPSILIADATLAKTKLAWSAQRDIEEIMRDAWSWHCKNPNGYDE